MINIFISTFLVIVVTILSGIFILKNLIYVCGPNEALIFAGSRTKTRLGERGYRIIRGGRGMRVPLFETVDRLNLTNMSIEVSVTNAYARGGIPLSVSGVANIKIASHSPTLDNAIERLLGKSHKEIIRIAKETLEGNLRGVLSQLTPEEVNEDKTTFSEKLLEEADHDLERLGLILDTLKIQNVTDDRGFLDSIGRIRSADVIKMAKISEAEAHAQATVREAENTQSARLAEIENQKKTISAEANRKIQDAKTKAHALIAEQRGEVQSQIARAKADIDVQKARVEQVRRQLEANEIEPAKAQMQAYIAQAKGNSASIIEDGKATVSVLNEMIKTWKLGGDSARDIFLMQKLQSVMGALVSSIDQIEIDKIAILPSTGSDSNSNSMATKMMVLNEEVKATMGVDLSELLENFAKK